MSHLGTLIVVVIKARNLPNKVRIGKQNPFATVTYGLSKKGTAAIVRGGQAPEWDDEFRFDIPRDQQDFLTDEVALVSRSGGVAPLGASESVPATLSRSPVKATAKSGGRKSLRVACFADDAKEPRMIGESIVDLTKALQQGEQDCELWHLTARKGDLTTNC